HTTILASYGGVTKSAKLESGRTRSRSLTTGLCRSWGERREMTTMRSAGPLWQRRHRVVGKRDVEHLSQAHSGTTPLVVDVTSVLYKSTRKSQLRFGVCVTMPGARPESPAVHAPASKFLEQGLPDSGLLVLRCPAPLDIIRRLLRRCGRPRKPSGNENA